MELLKNEVTERKIIIGKNGVKYDLTLEEAYKKYKGVIINVSNSYRKLENDDFDEILSIALIGFVKAYNNYNYLKDKKFTLFAETCIKQEILKSYRLTKMDDRFLPRDKDGNKIPYGNKHNIMTKSMDEEISSQKANSRNEKSMTTHSLEYDTKSSKVYDNFIENFTLNEAINYAKERVKERELNIFNDYYINGITQKDLSKKYNIDQAYVSRIIKKVLNKIRDYYKISGLL